MSRGAFPVLAAALALAAGGCVPSGPAWSPAGDRVAFVRDGSLFLADPAADAAPVLVAAGAMQFAFAPDGRRLYFLGKAPEGGEGLLAAELGADGPAPPELLLAAGQESFCGLQAAPDGRLYVAVIQGPNGPLAFEFDPAAGRRRDLAHIGGQWLSLTLSADGKSLFFLKGSALMRYALPDGPAAQAAPLRQPMAILAAAPGRVMVACKAEGYTAESPRCELALAALGGAKGAVRVFPLPEGRLPVMGAFAPDGKRFLVALLSEGGAESCELDLAGGKLTRLAAGREKLIGAPAWSPDGKRRVEFTAEGLALFEEGRPEPARLWPLDAAEAAAAARARLAAGRPQAALELADRWVGRAGPLDDRAALHRVRAEALEAAGRPAEAATAFLESIVRFPMTAEERPAAEVARRLGRCADAAPENRLLPALAEAYAQRAAGRSRQAAEQLKEASALAADRGWAAGLNFLAARSLLEAGQGVAAAQLFRRASEVAEFPQADWAAGLAVVAYVRGGREDLAAEEAMRCKDLYKSSPLAGDFAAMAKALAAEPARAETDEESGGPGGRARVERWPVTRTGFDFRGAGGRRLTVERGVYWRLVLLPAGGEARVLLDRSPVRLSHLAFAPGEGALAFLADFGAAGGSRLLAVDLAGKALLGDLAALAAGRPAGEPCPGGGFAWPAGAALPRPLRAPAPAPAPASGRR